MLLGPDGWIMAPTGYHSTLLGRTDLTEDLKNMFRGIMMRIGPVWGINSLSFILCCFRVSHKVDPLLTNVARSRWLDNGPEGEYSLM